jgi:predicted phosphodiesterase
MSLAFDLISDLHLETWSTEFDWTYQATSPVCIVAGDVCRDPDMLVRTLKHLGKCYQAVFYVDGNDEHYTQLEDLGHSYSELTKRLRRIPNVVYLQDNVVIVDGVAILGTNGWWGFDFDLGIDPEQAAQWAQGRYHISESATKGIARMSSTDATYMISSVSRLQTHKEVRKIVMVTHTVPDPALVAHDIDLEGTMRFNTMGNRLMMQAMAADTENKLHTWCFGHYHGNVDQTRSGIRFVNNCRGRGDTPYAKPVYYPQRIVVNF